MANKERIERDADRIRRASIPTIRDVEVDTTIKSDVVDTVSVFSLSGTSQIALSKTWTVTPKAVIITNTHDTISPKVSLWWERSVDPTVMYVLYKTIVPTGGTLLLDETDITIDSLGGPLYIRMYVDSGSPTVNVRIKQ